MRNKKKLQKKEDGVTLIALIITIAIMIILAVTVTINAGQLKEVSAESNLKKDIAALDEEVSQYFIRTKKIPVINEYKNTSMLSGVKNVNDNDKYYIIDIDQLDVKLNYGKDYDYAKITDKNLSFPADTSLTDIYIINEQSHTIYYPKGIEYNGSTHYSLEKEYSNVKDKQNIINGI